MAQLTVQSAGRGVGRWFLIALVAAEVTSSLEVTMVYTALPSLTRIFHDPAAVGWIITACLLVSAAAAALCGRLGDLYGHRRLLLIVLMFCVFGSFISAFSTRLEFIILGASLQGASGAVLPLCLALVRLHAEPERVPPTIGLLLAFATGTAALGLAVGGFLVDHAGWNSIFVVSGSWALVGWLMTWRFVPALRAPAERERDSIDMVRGILFVPAITGLLLSVSLAKDHGGDVRIILLAIGSAVLLAFWIRHQLAQQHPLIHLHAFSDRRVAAACFCMAMVGLGMTQHTLILGMLLQQGGGVGFGLAAATAGALLMPVRLIGTLSSAVTGRLILRYGAPYALLLGAAMASAGWAMILLFRPYLPVVMVGMLLEGAAYLICYVAVPNILLEATPPERAGEVTGLSTVFRAAFSAIGAQMVMLLLSIRNEIPPGAAHAQPSVFSYQLGLIFILGACLSCTFVAWRLARGSRPIPMATASEGSA